MSRPELTEVRRFGNWIVRGLGGLLNILRDYTTEGEKLSPADMELLDRGIKVLQEIQKKQRELIERADRG